MKKFYESPIVEITVFDVEDVITTSVTTAGVTGQPMADYIADVKADLGMDTSSAASEVYDFQSVYQW